MHNDRREPDTVPEHLHFRFGPGLQVRSFFLPRPVGSPPQPPETLASPASALVVFDGGLRLHGIDDRSSSLPARATNAARAALQLPQIATAPHAVVAPARAGVIDCRLERG